MLTLGQAPREDVTPTFRAILGDGVRIVERGALDGLDGPALAAITAGPGEDPMETRLGSGPAIGLRREALVPLLVEAGWALERDCDLVVLLCSGEFPVLAAACPRIVQPIHLLRGILHGLAGGRQLGWIGPASDQPSACEQWAPYVPNLICEPASPYQPLAAALQAAESLVRRGAEMIFLDDMGFREEHRAAIAVHGLPVFCATTLVARILRDLR
jgi:protein AroM